MHWDSPRRPALGASLGPGLLVCPDPKDLPHHLCLKSCFGPQSVLFVKSPSGSSRHHLCAGRHRWDPPPGSCQPPGAPQWPHTPPALAETPAWPHTPGRRLRALGVSPAACPLRRRHTAAWVSAAWRRRRTFRTSLRPRRPAQSKQRRPPWLKGVFHLPGRSLQPTPGALPPLLRTLRPGMQEGRPQAPRRPGRRLLPRPPSPSPDGAFLCLSVSVRLGPNCLSLHGHRADWIGPVLTPRFNLITTVQALSPQIATR